MDLKSGGGLFPASYFASFGHRNPRHQLDLETGKKDHESIYPIQTGPIALPLENFPNWMEG